MTEDAPRDFVPVDPASRPVRHRRTARVVLVDPEDRTLLFRDSDPGVPGRSWWITPGGGVDDGETDEQTALREVAEETGHVLDPAALRGPVARRHVLHGYADVVVDQHDVFFVARVPAFELDRSGHTEEELLTLTAHRWWRRTEVEAADEEIWPADLLALWDLADEPARWPVDLGEVEESTVPVT